MYNRQEQKPKPLKEGKIYQIEGKIYLIDQVEYNKTYAFLLDENNRPHGRRRILGSLKNKEVIEI